MKYDILMATLQVIPDIYCIYKPWISTIGFRTVKGYFKITKILPSSIMRCESGGNNTFKDLLIKMQFSKPVLLRHLRILGFLNKGDCVGISTLKEHCSTGFFLY